MPASGWGATAPRVTRADGPLLGAELDPAPHPTAARAIAALRRLRFGGPEITEILGMALSTHLGHPHAHRHGQAGPPEIITHGQTGLLVPPAEAEPLASALVQLLSDPPLSEAWGRNAHSAVTSRHRWSDVVDRISPALIAASNGAHRGVAASEDALLLDT